MINTLSTTPKILGPKQIPPTIKVRDLISKQVALELPEIKQGFAMAIQYHDGEALRVGRKQILMACSRIYGTGRIETASEGGILYVWLKPEDMKIAIQVKSHLMGTDMSVSYE